MPWLSERPFCLLKPQCMCAVSIAPCPYAQAARAVLQCDHLHTFTSSSSVCQAEAASVLRAIRKWGKQNAKDSVFEHHRPTRSQNNHGADIASCLHCKPGLPPQNRFTNLSSCYRLRFRFRKIILHPHEMLLRGFLKHNNQATPCIVHNSPL